MSVTPIELTLRAALAAHRQGDARAAESGYLQILAADPVHLDALHLLTALRLQQGLAGDALALAERVLTLAPDVADAHGNKGSALQALGRYGEAAASFRKAMRLAPEAAHHPFNLGNTLRADGDKGGAVRAYRAALALDPDLVQAHSNLAATLSEQGLFDDAQHHCREAITRAPDYAEAHYNLGNAYREAGAFQDAVAEYETALAIAPHLADAACNLGLVRMRDDPERAVEAFAHALTVKPGHPMARYYQGVAMELAGGNGAAAFAELDAADPMAAGWLDSWAYVQDHADAGAVHLHDPFAVLSHAMAAATVDGLILEFGVRHGQSIRHIAAATARPVHGFDSFAGLPTAWGAEPAGVYTTDGRLPEVPANVTLHPGLFEDTLDPFLASHPGPVRFCNVDCDLYASTVTVLDALAPRIVAGSVLVFDEYLVNPTWRDDEWKAFQEAVARNGWRYRYLALGIVTKQAAVLIL